MTVSESLPLKWVARQCEEGGFQADGLLSGMVFEGTTGVYGCIYRFNSRRVTKKMDLKNIFWRFYLIIISAQRLGLKTGMDFRGLVSKRV